MPMNHSIDGFDVGPCYFVEDALFHRQRSTLLVAHCPLAIRPGNMVSSRYIGSWLIRNMTIETAAKALSNERRLEILRWLKDPVVHFRRQVDGDLVKDGVCGLLLAEKLGVSQPTASEHLKVLTQAGFLRTKRIKQWTFYQRDEVRIREFKKLVRTDL